MDLSAIRIESTAFRDTSSSDDEDSEADLQVDPDPFSPDTLLPHRFSSAYTTDLYENNNDNDNLLDQDFLAALFSLDIEGDHESPHYLQDNEKLNSNNNKDDESPSEDFDNTLPETLSSSPLPDIEFDFGENDSFVDFEQLEHIFDQQSEDTEFAGEFHFVDDPETALRIDQDTEDLYRDLASLSLRPALPASMEQAVPEEDDLPPYLYCQPCTPDSELFDPFSQALAPIGEEEQFPDMQVHRQSSLMATAEELRQLLEHEPEAFNLLRLDEDDRLIQQMEVYHDLRPEAFEAAIPFVEAFGLVDLALGGDPADTSSKQRSCFTHRETIFGVTFSECGRFCASASQDSTICIWHVPTNALLAQLKDHSKDYECLRVAWASQHWASHSLDRAGDLAHLVASSGADGVVKLWACPDPLDDKKEWKCIYTLDHATLLIRTKDKEESKENDTTDDNIDPLVKKEDDRPQTYTLQFIDHWQAFNTAQTNNHTQNSFIMTSSDEFIHFWEVVTHKSVQSIELLESGKVQVMNDKIELMEVMSLHFGELESPGFGVTVCTVTGSGLPLPPPPNTSSLSNGEASGFGGARNPDNKVFVFDAAYCKANGLLGVALSDGSLRLINGRGICISILNLPGCQSHLTSFCWDSTGTKLATSVATGHLITWTLDIGDAQGQGPTVAACTAIMEGGHQLGRPLFGSRYCGKDENLIVSWCVDGSLCLWDSYSSGNVHAPIAVLQSDPKYPIYAVELSNDTIAVGGGADGGFIGIPLYLYTVGGGKDEATTRSPVAKRPTTCIPQAKDIESSTPEKKSKMDHESNA